MNVLIVDYISQIVFWMLSKFEVVILVTFLQMPSIHRLLKSWVTNMLEERIKHHKDKKNEISAHINAVNIGMEQIKNELTENYE